LLNSKKCCIFAGGTQTLPLDNGSASGKANDNK
jgi:hypothetical protein